MEENAADDEKIRKNLNLDAENNSKMTIDDEKNDENDGKMDENFERIDFSKGLPVNLVDLGLSAAETDENLPTAADSPPEMENSAEIMEISTSAAENSDEIVADEIITPPAENGDENFLSAAENSEVVALSTPAENADADTSSTSSGCEILSDDEDPGMVPAEIAENAEPVTVESILRAAQACLPLPQVSANSAPSAGPVTAEDFLENLVKFVENRRETIDFMRISDVIRRFRDEQSRSRPLGVKKLLDSGALNLPINVTVPPSQIVQMLAEFPSDQSLTELKATFRDENSATSLSTTEIVQRAPFARESCPNFTKFLYDIGFSLCLETTYRNLIARHSSKPNTDTNTLKTNYEGLKRKNACLKMNLHKCTVSGCTYASDTVIGLDLHKQQPHRAGGGRWLCAVCEIFKSTDRQEMSEHYLDEHQLAALFEQPTLKAPCPICDRDFNTKYELKDHFKDCRQRYRNVKFMAVREEDVDVINRWLWPKTRQVVSERLLDNRQLIQVPVMPVAGQRNVRKSVQDVVESVSMGEGRLAPRPRFVRTILPAVPFGKPLLPANAGGATLLLRNGNSLSIMNSNQLQQQLQPNILIKPAMPRQPALAIRAGVSTGVSVLCEICDAYFDSKFVYMAHLREHHRQLTDKTDGQLSGPAPLACSKCKERFYTYDGLERHLLMKHSLVTSDLLQKAHRKQDNGKCKLCGKVYAFNLLHHLVQDHKLNLCSAEILYNCDLCPFQCKSYVLLDNHLKGSHSKQFFQPHPQPPAPTPTAAQHQYAAAACLKRPAGPFVRPPPAKLPRLQPANNVRGPFRSLSAQAVGAAPLKPVTHKYCCTPCNLRFAVYNDVIQHWVDKHLKHLQINVCRVDQCDTCGGKFENLGVQTDFTAYEYNSDNNEDEDLEIISEKPANSAPEDEEIICLD